MKYFLPLALLLCALVISAPSARAQVAPEFSIAYSDDPGATDGPAFDNVLAPSMMAGSRLSGNGDAQVTTPIMYMIAAILVAACLEPNPGKATPEQCEIMVNPPATDPPVSFAVPANETLLITTVFDNTGGPSDEPTVDAFNPTLSLFFDNPALEILGFTIEQDGPYMTCDLASEGIGVECAGSSIPNEKKVMVHTEVQVNSETQQTVVASGEVNAGNSINNALNSTNLALESTVPTGTVRVRKYIDREANGVVDPTDPFASTNVRWDFTLNGETKTTDDQGYVVFENVPVGMHVVEETQLPGFASSSGETTQEVTVTAGETTDVVFLNFEYAEVTIVKFHDLDGDGEKDENEMGIDDWEFTTDDDPPLTGTTANGGELVFDMVRPGMRTITETPQEGWEPSSGSLETTVDLITGEHVTREIGNYQPGKIIVMKYEDLNGDGEDNDSAPLSDWVFTVDGPSADDVELTTDAEGMAMIDGLAPGTYTVTEQDVSGWELSDGDNPTTVEILSGDEVEVTFGNFEYAKIHGTKYRDENGNGAVDLPDDVPLSGWTIKCTGGPSCDPERTTVTDNNGQYWFEMLEPGSYTIEEVVQPNWIAISPAGGVHANITVTSGEERMEVDFHNMPPEDENDPGIIWAQKFLDSSDDGAFDANEVGLNGVTINLIQNGAVIASGITADAEMDNMPGIDPHADRGWVMFGPIPAGNYTLEEVIPAGMEITTPLSNSIAVALAEGEIDKNSLFGNHAAIDFGDAPQDEEDPPNADFPDGYPTRVDSSGAAHVIDEEVFLGDRIDPEGDGQPTLPADGDDKADGSDDEDGVEFGPEFAALSFMLPGDDDEMRVPGQIRGTTARIILFPSVNGELDAWVDWNRDGDWEDDGEQVYDDEPISASSDTLDWPVPEDASDGFTYVRFRYSLDGVESFKGVAPIGEVEDYVLYTLSEEPIDSDADTEDANPGDGVCADVSGFCTLRAAIMEANASGVPWVVNGGGLGKRGQATLAPQSPYPAITGSIMINGGGTLEIDGSQAGVDADGLTFDGSGSTLAGTVIHSFDRDGVHISGENNTVVNARIRDNGRYGVHVAAGSGNSIRMNAIFGNGDLGIDLGGDGVTANDAGDEDIGPNGLQNFPILGGASTMGDVTGTLDSDAESTFILDFFVGSECSSLVRTGEMFIGSTTVTTDGSGSASFNVEFPDSGLMLGDFISVTATAPDGSTSEFSECVSVMSVDIERREDAELPNGYTLKQNYPNPFNPVTTFSFTVPQSEFVSIDVFDLLGKRVANVVSRQVPAGEYSVQFDASALPSGTYVYRMTAGAFTQTRQFTLLK